MQARKGVLFVVWCSVEVEGSPLEGAFQVDDGTLCDSTEPIG